MRKLQPIPSRSTRSPRPPSQKVQSASDWPSQTHARLANHAVDQHMLAFYERQSGATIRSFQLRKLEQLLTHATQHSVWWLKHLPPLSDRTLSFRDLPLLTREEYRASVRAAGGPLPMPGAHGRAVKNATSGSSGIPLEFYVSQLAGRMNGAHYYRDRVRHRFNANRPFARIGTTVDPHEGEHVHVPSNALLGLNEEFQRRSKQFTVEEHARWITNIEPGYVYASATLLSGFLDSYEQGIAASPVAPVLALLSFAETVTAQLRQQAHRILHARVLDRYSAEEIGPMAFQCPVSDEHYHLAATNSLVEVLDDAGRPCAPGEIGRVIATNLHNWASPVVRYELGDLAAWRPRCVCGHDGPVLSQLLGRKRFLIRLPSGERQYVLVNAKNWLSVAPVKEARVVQVSERVIHAECVPERPLTGEERENVVAMLRREITPDFTYFVKELDRIDWGPTYKRQDVVSLV